VDNDRAVRGVRGVVDYWRLDYEEVISQHLTKYTNWYIIRCNKTYGRGVWMAKIKTLIELQGNKFVSKRWDVIIYDEDRDWDRDCETPKIFHGQLIANAFDFEYMAELAHFFTQYGNRKIVDIDICKEDKIIRVDI